MLQVAGTSPYTTMLIIPTGIGAKIGGYAGDGLPTARLVSQVCDRLITHPNVLNGAQLFWNMSNALYVEGYGLDQFAAGNWGLRPVRQNRVGMILDQGIEEELRLRHIQAADACRATLGLSVTDYVVTDAPLNVNLKLSETGASWGTIDNVGSLLRAAEKLITQAKVEAIAVVARFPDDEDSELLAQYRQGEGVDGLAGAEAVISHLLVKKFQIPCAHAPALAPIPIEPDLSPKTAAEELGYTFLPCVLAGLSHAPQFVVDRKTPTLQNHGIWSDTVDSLVIPASACGGSAVLSLSHTKTLIIAVNENDTALSIFPETIGVQACRVDSYLEAIGMIVAHRAGLDLQSLTPSVPSINAI
ncbi:hypothetical protein Lepto7376_2770 [[Leptolyngbya] sp. PCC 7376]|uniref:DUF3326 domain-containing protein n=1 Tax=[Leptolyngbya] sp. PCC 7376 TaxID=111781 RepID=UPI00029ED5ED|nr:DUF3326 domain-containing protein [[Leptolyngbya] sp. PCC 7376]AFY39028.1 hypothetical protein Lepto7376_2770 [[Leptolyngbya] sp. PCC 7376]